MRSSNINIEEIKTLKRDEFNSVFQIYKELGEYERHFNHINGIYKSLASTWLLAFFGAIGYVLTSNFSHPEQSMFIFGLGLAASVGVLLLWLIDMRVYQNLLTACFHQGRALEQGFAWLPPLRYLMTRTQVGGKARTNLVWFYIIGMALPALISVIGLFSFISHYKSLFYRSVGSFVGLLMASLILYGIRKVFLESKLRVTAFDMKFQTKQVDYPKKEKVKGFFVLNICKVNNASLSLCQLEQGKTTVAQRHRTVEEIWFFISGKGEIWLKQEQIEKSKEVSKEETKIVKKNTCITIPANTHFQLRNTSDEPLIIVVTTAPPWPGKQENLKVEGNEEWKDYSRATRTIEDLS